MYDTIEATPVRLMAQHIRSDSLRRWCCEDGFMSLPIAGVRIDDAWNSLMCQYAYETRELAHTGTECKPNHILHTLQ